MKRVIALLVVVVAAALIAWKVGQSRDPDGVEVCATVEKLLKTREYDAAQKAVDAARIHVPLRVSRYLDALLQFAIANQLDPATQREQIVEHDRLAAQAAEDAYADGPAALDDWRIVSMVVVTRLQARRIEGAWDAIDLYVKAHPTDERALAAAADYWVRIRRDAPDPTAALEYIARIDALKSRTVPDTDPTALSPAFLAKTRSLAEGLIGHTTAALAAAEQRVRASESDASAWAQLAEARRAARRPTEAIAAYRKSVELDPSGDAYARNLSSLLFDDPDAAPELMSLTERIVRANPEDPQAQILRARALVRNQDFHEEMARQAGKPFDPHGVQGYAEAIELYQALLARDPPIAREAARDVHRNLGMALYDWKEGGRKGEYMERAHVHLRHYVRLGGVVDGALRDPWEKLESMYGAPHAGGR